MPQDSSVPPLPRGAFHWLLLTGAAVLLTVVGVFIWIQRTSPASTTSARVIADGTTVPAIAQPSTTGQALSLSQFTGKKVVVYFYEGAG
ncbi:MAG TPA: hypothetical protein VEL12_09740 [Candidatus Nitrosopolaris sp.]|nr:hypothetical protein [Candidatus Nitrosopolaris sp.]